MAIFSAYVGLMLRWCQSSQGVFQYQSDGRAWPQVENTVGYFASVLYLPARLEENTTFLDLLDQVTEEYGRALDHADFSSYLAAQVPRLDVTRNPGLNWLPRRSKEQARATHGSASFPIDCEPVPFSHPMVKDLVMDVEPALLMSETDDELSGEWYYPRDRLSAETMETVGRSLVGFLDVLLCEPARRVNSVYLPQSSHAHVTIRQ